METKPSQDSRMARVLQFMEAPVFQDDVKKSRHAYRLNAASLIGILLLSVYGISFALARPAYSYRVGLVIPMIAVCIVTLILIRWGRVSAASQVFLFGAWSIVTFAVLTSGGIQAPLYAFYSFVVMSAVIFTGWRSATFYACLTLASGLLMVLLAESGSIPESFASPLSAWITHTTMLILVAVDAYIIVQDHNLALVRLAEELVSRKATEERFKALIANSSDVISTLNADGVITYQSFSAKRMLGYDPEEMLGQNAFSYIHADDLANVQQAFAERITTDHPVTKVDFRFRHKEGHWVHLETTAANLLDDPVIQGVVVNSRYVSDRVEAEKRLRVSESRYRALVENLPGSAAIMYDRDLRFVLVDGPETKNTGYDKASMEGHTLYESVPADFAKLAEPNMKAVLEGKSFSAELPFGDLIYKYSYLPLENEAGEITHGLILAQNITAWKTSQEALRQSESKSRDFQEQLKKLHEVSTELTTVQSLEELYRRGIELAREKLGFDRIGILMLDEENGLIRCTFGVDTEGNVRDERHLSRPIDQDRVYKVLPNQHGVQVWNDIDLLDNWQTVGRGWVANAWMFDGEKTIGFVPADNLLHGEPVNENRLELLNLFAVTMGHLITRKRAEEALKESEERYRTLIEALPDAVVVTRIDRTVLFVNKAMEEQIGFTADELNNPERRDFIHRDDLAGVLQFIDDLIESDRNTTDPFEYRVIDKHGNPRWFSGIVTKVQWDGQTALQIVTRDVTQQKQTEKQILEERQLLRTVLDTIPNAVYVKDTESRFVMVNQNVLDWHSLASEDEIIGKTDLDIVGSSTWDISRPDELRIMRQETRVVIGEYPAINGAGERRWLSIIKVPVYDAGRNIIGILGVNHDITHFKQMQSELEQERNLMRTLIDNIPDHIFVKDREGRFLLVSKSLQDHWNIDLIGKTDFDLIPFERAQVHRDEEDRIIATGQPLIDLEMAPVNDHAPLYEDVERDWQSSTKIPLTDSQGNITGIVGINRIITQRKKAENELRESEARYRIISELISDYAFSYDVSEDGELNPSWITEESFKRITGYTWGEIGSTFSLFHPDDKLIAQQHVKELLNGKPNRGDYRIFTKSGQTRWLHMERLPVWDEEQGRVTRYYGAAADITERKTFENEQQFYAKLFHSVSDAIITMGLDYRIISWNKGAERIFGWSESEALGELFGEVLPTTVVDANLQIVVQTILNAGHWSGEAIQKRRDGSNVHVFVSGSLVKDSQGNPTSIIAIAQDVTSMKQAERLRTESEQKFRTIFEFLQAAILITDKTGAIIDANPFASVQMKTDNNFEIVGSNLGDLKLTNLGDLDSLIAEIIETGRAVTDLTCTYTKDNGTTLELLVSITPVRLNEDIYLLWVAFDITHLKETELALRESEARLKLLNGIANDISALTNLDSTLRRVLQKLKSALPLDAFFVALYDPNTEEAHYPIMYDSGKFWQEPSRKLSQTSYVIRVISDGQPLLVNRTPEEMEHYRKSTTNIGDTSRVSASIMVVPLSLGRTNIGVMSVQSYELDSYDESYLELVKGAAYQIAIAVDNARLYDSLRIELEIRQQAEQEVSQLNAQLEQRVVQRTAQLEMVNKELEAFAYSVSHDLRAPLRSIDGFSRIVLETTASKLDENEQNYLDRIRTATQRMGDMIDGLLSLSRVTRSELHFQTVNLSELAEDILRTHVETSPDRKVIIQVQPGLITQGDNRLLRIVLENLLGNAWKYTGRTEQAIIEVGARSDDVVPIFYVRDNGAGFDEAYKDKLFGVFQRLHTDKEFPGTGVGLATVQRIIHRHGGKIWAESTQGKGTTFYFVVGGQRN